MKFSENWLRQHVRIDATRDELAATLTAIGLEVEALDAARRSARRRRRRADLSARKASRSRPPAGLPGRCRHRRDAADRLRRAECARRPGRAARDHRHEDRRHHDQGGEAARRRIQRHAVLGEGTRHRRRCVRPAGAARRRAGRRAAGANISACPTPASNSSSRPNRADCFSVRGIAFDVAAACGSEVVRARRDADARAGRRRAARSDWTPAPMRRATSAA